MRVVIKKFIPNKIMGPKVFNKITRVINNSRVRSRVHNERGCNTLDFRITEVLI